MNDGRTDSVCSRLLIVALFSLVTTFAMSRDNEEANVSRHLGVVGRVNLGSFYTPAKYVECVGEWLRKHGIGHGWTIADLSCGYGAFFELSEVSGLSECRFVGNDIDPVAVEKARTLFTNVQWSVRNALSNVSRKSFGFADTEKIVIVGNPPYNDVTSQINRKLKSGHVDIDSDLRTRDLGLSSLLSYNKLRVEYAAILHPLSYLIKKTNFQAAMQFFSNYRLVEHVVFPSQEFAATSRIASFPVIVALYQRVEEMGLSYDEVRDFWFKTTDGTEFSLMGFDYVTDEVDKYPGHKRFSPEILFYTLRDINALKRSRTFIDGRMANAVDVDPDKLAYYCYIDCFKRYSEPPYYLGNFNVPFIRSEFNTISNDVVIVSKANHPEIFGETTMPDSQSVARVKEYICRSIKGKDKSRCQPKKQR